MSATDEIRDYPNADEELTDDQREMLERVAEESDRLAPYAEGILEYYGELDGSGGDPP